MNEEQTPDPQPQEQEINTTSPMKRAEALALARRIRREAPSGTTATIEPDEMVPWCNDYHVQVVLANVMQFIVRSAKQWEERKHLLRTP